jgi:hypothetical protein
MRGNDLRNASLSSAKTATTSGTSVVGPDGARVGHGLVTMRVRCQTQRLCRSAGWRELLGKRSESSGRLKPAQALARPITRPRSRAHSAGCARLLYRRVGRDRANGPAPEVPFECPVEDTSSGGPSANRTRRPSTSEPGRAWRP